MEECKAAEVWGEDTREEGCWLEEGGGGGGVLQAQEN